MPRAGDEASFTDGRIRMVFDPVAVPLASDIGAFRDTPVRVADNPVAVLLAVLETPRDHLFVAVPDPGE